MPAPVADGANASKSVSRAAVKSIEELVDMFFKWLAPILAFIVGLTIAINLGGDAIFYNLQVQVFPSTASNAPQAGSVARWLTAALWLGVGASVFIASSGVGKWGSVALRLLGAFFLGAGVAWIGNAINIGATNQNAGLNALYSMIMGGAQKAASPITG